MVGGDESSEGAEVPVGGTVSVAEAVLAAKAVSVVGQSSLINPENLLDWAERQRVISRRALTIALRFLVVRAESEESDLDFLEEDWTTMKPKLI